MLPLIFAGIIFFCVIMYVVLDGFTLGTGIVFPFMKDDQRNIAMSVILPTWDGNQTWLVLGMATLYGSFPSAFSLLLPVLYMPLLVMVMSLLLRGVAFEFRLKSTRGVRAWDWVFILASITVAMVQGIILGAMVEGFAPVAKAVIVPPEHWVTPFTLLCGISVVIGYGLLGSTRLILKTTGSLQDAMYKIAWRASFFIAFALVAVSLWTPFIHPDIKALWFNESKWPYLAILPLTTGIAFLLLLKQLRAKKETSPYWLAVALFFCPYVGFTLSIYPYIVPYHLTIWQAAAPANSLTFLLVGMVIMLPVLLIYTGYSYRIFSGKVKDVLHY